MFEPRDRSHRQVAELLSAYLDNMVTADERRLVESHLAGCQACQQQLLALRQTVNLLRRLPPIALPRSFVLREADLAPRSPLTRLRRPFSRGFGRAPALATGVALVLCAAFLGTLLLTTRTQPSNLAMQPAASPVVGTASRPLPTHVVAPAPSQTPSEAIAQVPVTLLPTATPTGTAAEVMPETRREDTARRTLTVPSELAEKVAPAPRADELSGATPVPCEVNASCQVTAAMLSPTPALAPSTVASPVPGGPAGATAPQVALAPAAPHPQLALPTAGVASATPGAMAAPLPEQPEGESRDTLRAAGAAPSSVIPMAPALNAPVLITVTNPMLVIGPGVITISGWLPLPEGILVQAEVWRDGRPLEWAIPESQLTRLGAAGSFSLHLQARLDQPDLDLSEAPPGDYEIRIRSLDERLSAEARLPLPVSGDDTTP